MKSILTLLLCCIISFKAFSQQTQTDTGKKINIADTLKKNLLLRLIPLNICEAKLGRLSPGSTGGLWHQQLFLKPVRRLDVSIYNDINEDAPNFKHHPENYFQYTPVALVYALNLVGIHGKNTFVDRSLIFVMAEGMMGLTTFGLKKVTHRLRPDGSDYNSFPSGHTANAFLGAEFMAQELGDKSIGYSVIGYGFATATGILRMYNRDHWFSDVVAGAGFGILSAKAAYLLYPYIRNRLFKAGREKEDNRNIPDELKKQPKTSSIIMPSYNNGIVGLNFAMQF